MHVAIAWMGLVLQLALLDTSTPVQGNGFAAKIVGAFFGLGVLVLFMRWISKRPGPPRSRR